MREFETYDEVRASATEASVGELRGIADFVVDTERTPAEAVFTPAATKLGLYAIETEKLVDVIVGAQYGSEGKGNISGTGSNRSAKILIGAGTTIWVPRILKEILDWG